MCKRTEMIECIAPPQYPYKRNAIFWTPFRGSRNVVFQEDARKIMGGNDAVFRRLGVKRKPLKVFKSRQMQFFGHAMRCEGMEI